MPSWFIKKTEDMENYLETQLDKLQTDHIDYYLLHSLGENNFVELEKLGVLEFLESAKRDGKINNIGFSFHDNREAFKKIVDSYNWDACLIQYNFLDENNQAGTEGLNYAASKGLTVFVMEPLKGGILVKNVPEKATQIWNKSVVKRTPAEWALRWVLNHPEVTSVISGMGKMEEIKENIEVTNDTSALSIPKEELDLYSEVKDIYNELMKVDCTGCGYCLPCPAGVNIPFCFELYNQKYIFNNNQVSFIYAMYLGGSTSKEGYAGLCNGCGKCLKVCPQKLDVPSLLSDVSNDVEGAGFKYKVKVMGFLGKFIMVTLPSWRNSMSKRFRKPR